MIKYVGLPLSPAHSTGLCCTPSWKSLHFASATGTVWLIILLVSTIARMFWPTATKVVGAMVKKKKTWPTDDTITPIFGDRLNKYLAYPGRSSSMSHSALTGGRTGEASQQHSTGLTLNHVCLWTQLRPTCGSLELIGKLPNRIWNGTMEWFEFIATFVQGKELVFHHSMAGFKGKSTGKLVLSGGSTVDQFNIKYAANRTYISHRQLCP